MSIRGLLRRATFLWIQSLKCIKFFSGWSCLPTMRLGERAQDGASDADRLHSELKAIQRDASRLEKDKSGLEDEVAALKEQIAQVTQSEAALTEQRQHHLQEVAEMQVRSPCWHRQSGTTQNRGAVVTERGCGWTSSLGGGGHDGDGTVNGSLILLAKTFPYFCLFITRNSFCLQLRAGYSGFGVLRNKPGAGRMRWCL